MTKQDLIDAAMASDLAIEQTDVLSERQFLLDASWAYKVAYLMLVGRPDLLWAEERSPVDA